MAIEVAKVDPEERAGRLRAGGAASAQGQFAADEVIAVIGKTEGNGGVNDFTRILADQAFRAVLVKHGKRAAKRMIARSRWCGRAAATA